VSGPRLYLTTDGGSVAVVRDGPPIAEGRIARRGDGWEVAVEASAGSAADAEALGLLLDHLVALTVAAGNGSAHWTVTEPTAAHDSAAAESGLAHRRDLLQLRRPLPVEAAIRDHLPSIVTRAFRPGQDEQAWLAANNRAFADHPDQGGRTAADLERLEASPWFDPEGFLLLDAPPDEERAGSIDAFCWTKVHGDHEPPLGEIFVIGVNPDAQRRGLGAAMTVAGLDHLAQRGLPVGMLYVDVINTRARELYDRLGFGPHHLDRVYSNSPPD